MTDFDMAIDALIKTRAERERLRKFAEWIVSLDDDDPESPGRQARKTVTLSNIIDRARKACKVTKKTEEFHFCYPDSCEIYGGSNEGK